MSILAGILCVLASCALADPCSPDATVPCVKLAGGEPMPLVAMGSWTGSAGECAMGNFTCTRAYATKSLKSWLEMGGRHIDTANDYKNQVAIGQLLKSLGIPREELFITTKCPGIHGYDATVQCVNDALQMLDIITDGGKIVNGYINLVLIHYPWPVPISCSFQDDDLCTDPTSLEAYANISKGIGFRADWVPKAIGTWKALEDMKKMGVLKSIGVSSYNIKHLQTTLEAATEPIDVNQVRWNPLDYNDEVLNFCKQHGIQLQAWSPLGGVPEFDKIFGFNGSLMTLPVIKKIAHSHGVCTAQVILKWSLQKGVAITTSSINPAHQKADMDLWSFTLTSAEMQILDNIAKVPAPPLSCHTVCEDGKCGNDCPADVPVCKDGTCWPSNQGSLLL